MMKDRVRKIIWRIKLLLALFVLLLFVPRVFAEGLDPYSHNPLNELQAEFKPSLLPPVLRTNQAQRQDLPDSAPQTPAMVTDADGNKLLYQDGKLLVKIDPQGTQTFYSNGLPIFEKDDTGYLTRTYEHSGARTTIKNEFGEVVGYQESGLGGLLLRGYDEKSRFTQKYEYEGRRMKAMVDTLTNSRTLYNERGKPDREVNFHGATTMTYHYRDDGRLAYKEDLYGNRTTYDDIGRPQFGYDFTGAMVETYRWTSLNTYEMTDQNGNTTYVDHDRTQYVRNHAGFIKTRYNWQGTKLLSSEYTPTIDDLEGPEITYYDNGRAAETKYKGYTIALWKYDEDYGILISKTELTRQEGKVKTTYYDHGREGVIIEDSVPDLISLDYNYKPVLFDQIAELVRKYKDTSQSIMPYIDEILKNEGNAANGKGHEGTDEVPPDNDDNGRHVGPPEETPPNAPPEIPDGQDDEEDGPGRHVGPPEN